MSVREQLRQLHKLGWDVRVLGATIFDSPNGITRLSEHWEKIKQSRSKIVKVNDGPLTHHLVKTKSTQRAEMTAAEEAVWYQAYTKFLDQFKPDIVYYYGGRTLDLLIGDEAHARNIPVASYLANGNYRGLRWCRNVDLIITNSNATAELYKAQDGLESVVIGPFVEPKTVIAPQRNPENVVSINPSLAKGAAIVAAVASMLEHERPDITFEIVESRGDWASISSSVRRELGYDDRQLRNVIVTPNQRDMRKVYSRTKLLLIMSLWWESLPRVAIEAALNGIPCIGTRNSGIPEAIGSNENTIAFSKACYSPPYTRLPPTVQLERLKRKIELLHDDEEHFNSAEQLAQKMAQKFNLQQRAASLSTALKTAVVTAKDEKLPGQGKIANLRRDKAIIKKKCGYHANFTYPKTFNEKICNRKNFNAPKAAHIYQDKLAAREMVRGKVGASYLPEIYEITESPETIAWQNIPPQFAMKSNHSNGQVEIVRGLSGRQKTHLTIKAREWLRSRYGATSGEHWYREIKPKLYFEELLDNGFGETPADFKVHCFNGEPLLVQVIEDRGNSPKENFYTNAWELTGYTLTYPPAQKKSAPGELSELLSIAKILSADIDYIRADFYIVKGRILFGEFTLAPAAGWDAWRDLNGIKSAYDIDLEIGRNWSIRTS
jgi:glycosyltransferase involved in cell wall biosynthesis